MQMNRTSFPKMTLVNDSCQNQSNIHWFDYNLLVKGKMIFFKVKTFKPIGHKKSLIWDNQAMH